MSVSDGAIPFSSGASVEYQQEQEQQQQKQQQQLQQQILAGDKNAVNKSTMALQNPVARPEDLSVTPWYFEDYPTTDTSPGPMGDRSSYPSYADDRDGRPDLNSTRNSSIESDFSKSAMPVPRKACMDLRTAMALLDETCPNVEHSPSLTPRTPRTPLTPYSMRSKRARSKSSDNSSYSNDRLSDRSFETIKDKDKDKKRPFLRKIGISKTEDRPFLAKLTPRVIGKPYLEKIGPSKAIVERPFLDKIGSSKTLDKFIFDTSHNERKSQVKNTETKTSDAVRNHIGVQNNVIHETDGVIADENIENSVKRPTSVISHLEQVRESSVISQTSAATFERRRSGKQFLLKMYSFETEDLECPVPLKGHRDPLRGSSLDDVLDSGPCSLPSENSDERAASKPELQNRSTSVTCAELLKCRVTTSEEIISSSTTCLDKSAEVNSWSNTPCSSGRAAQRVKKEPPIRRRALQDSREILRSGGSTPNSPTKRPISSVSPDRDIESEYNTLERGTLSPMKTRKSTVEDIRKAENTPRSIKYNQFERRGISSDNLLAKDALSFSTVSRTITDDSGRMREISSEDSLAIRRGVQEYTKETFKQLQDKFKLQEISTESYAAFKRRTRAAHGAISRQERLNLLPAEPNFTGGTKIWTSVARMENVATIDIKPPITIGTTENKREQSQENTTRSTLKKQEGIDHASDQESDTNASIRRPKRRIFHEPSQETMDLLTELRKIKSLLKTPSWEKDLDFEQKPTRMPKRILLTDKEFCLSVERENSVRRPSRMINSLETAEEGEITLNREQDSGQLTVNGETKIEQKSLGPALFEKKCLSLDYADEEKPQKPEARAISLASTRDLPFEIEEIDHYPTLTLTCDSKSYSSDVFNSPFEEMSKTDQIDEKESPEKEQPNKFSQNHCEVDIAIPIDQRIDKGDIQGRTSDLYEIISPRSTPFRVKKRLGKISVEETVKPENFTLGSKVDCRSVVAQKRTKCFPL